MERRIPGGKLTLPRKPGKHVQDLLVPAMQKLMITSIQQPLSAIRVCAISCTHTLARYTFNKHRGRCSENLLFRCFPDNFTEYPSAESRHPSGSANSTLCTHSCISGGCIVLFKAHHLVAFLNLTDCVGVVTDWKMAQSPAGAGVGKVSSPLHRHSRSLSSSISFYTVKLSKFDGSTESLPERT